MIIEVFKTTFVKGKHFASKERTPITDLGKHSLLHLRLLAHLYEDGSQVGGNFYFKSRQLTHGNIVNLLSSPDNADHCSIPEE